MDETNVIDVLEQNTKVLKQRHASIRGEIELLREEGIEIKAKLEHNTELLAFLRNRDAAQNANPSNTDIEN